MRKYIFPLGRLIALSVILIAIVATAVATVFFALKSKSEPNMENDVKDSVATEQAAADPSVATSEGPTIVSPVPVETSAVPAHPSTCSPKAKLVGLEKSKLTQLRRLADYQTLCGSFVSDRMMYFIGFPETSAKAKSIANNLARGLKEFHARGVTPIIVMEAMTDSGKKIRLADIAAGKYDHEIDSLFYRLKAAGITSDFIGIWVPYPEINTPDWNRTDFRPSDFGKMVNKFFESARKTYPDIQGSILLNDASYDAADKDWERPIYSNFDDYISAIAPATIQSFGVQGFPWKARASETSKSSIIDAQRFLHIENSIYAAKKLGVKSIWFNTGTFATMYRGSNIITSSPEERSTILNGILREADAVANAGYSITINLFAQNKLSSNETVDWSYGSLTSHSNPLRKILFDFISQAHSAGIAIQIFNM